MKISIVFPFRNRAKELLLALPTIVKKYQRRKDLELVCLDDGSTDDSIEVIRTVMAPWGRERVRIINFVRDQNAIYDWNPVRQYNELIKEALGEKLIIQSPEIAHIDNIAERLEPLCETRIAAFATVLNCARPIINNDFPFLSESFPEDRHFEPSTLMAPNFSYNAEFIEVTNIKRITGAYAQRTLKLRRHPEQVFRFDEYCSPYRTAPWFFCGMLMRADWIRLGGYRSVNANKFNANLVADEASDVDFGNRLVADGFRFRFTNALAIHLDHERS